MASNNTPSARVSRRVLMGASLASAAVVPLASLHRAAAGGVSQATSVTAAIQETSADPITWRTWLLASADELRPAAPGAPSQAEIDEVIAGLASRLEGARVCRASDLVAPGPRLADVCVLPAPGRMAARSSSKARWTDSSLPGRRPAATSMSARSSSPNR